jgi:hypothetical protein
MIWFYSVTFCKIQDYVMEEERVLKARIFAYFFRLYFFIAEDNLCISTMYYLLLYIYVVLIVKKCF